MSASAVRVKPMSFACQFTHHLLLPLLLVSTLAVAIAQSASAQDSSVPVPSLEPLEKELLTPNASLARRDIITENTISPTELTNPSFWWAQDQFNQFNGKLITDWIAYREKKRVDLVVNRQLWSLLDYLERYRFVNNFGSAARDYQYNVRVFNPQGVLLATYTCNYNPTLPECDIRIFDAFGQESLQVPRQ
ncbi:MAG TPA: hypothetical protein V6D50_11600 [Chroococcales cyanobacterium]